MKQCCLFIFTLWIFFPSEVLADGVSAEVDHTIVEIGEPVTFSVRIEGSSRSDAPEFSIKNVEIQYHGPQSNFSIVNGKTSSSTVHIYSLIATKSGRFTIPSLKVQIDGKQHATLPIKVEVKGAGQTKGAGQGPIFVERVFSKTEVYVGEPILVKVKVFQKAKLLGAEIDPATPGSVKRIPIEGQINSEEIRSGVRYRVAEISEVLIPLKAGNLEIPAFNVKAKYQSSSNRRSNRRRGRSPFDMFGDIMNDSFGRMKVVERTFSTKPKTLIIKNVPSQGRPSNFSSLVGNFSLQGNLSANNIKVGETVTLTLQLEGNGDLEGADDLIKIDNSNVKVYADKPAHEVSANRSGLRSKSIFKFAIVAQRGGEISLDAIKLSVFDPAQNKFVELVYDVPTILVEGGASIMENAGESPLRKSRVELLGSDLLAAHRGTILMESHLLSRSLFAGYAAVWSIPLLFGFVGWWRRRFDEDDEMKVLKKKSKAYRKFEKSIQGIKNVQQNLQIVQALQYAKEYIGDKFNVNNSSLTVGDIKKYLHVENIDEGRVKGLIEIFVLHNTIEYGGEKPGAEKISSSINELRVAIETLEKELTK